MNVEPLVSVENAMKSSNMDLVVQWLFSSSFWNSAEQKLPFHESPDIFLWGFVVSYVPKESRRTSAY